MYDIRRLPFFVFVCFPTQHYTQFASALTPLIVLVFFNRLFPLHSADELGAVFFGILRGFTSFVLFHLNTRVSEMFYIETNHFLSFFVFFIYAFCVWRLGQALESRKQTTIKNCQNGIKTDRGNLKFEKKLNFN